MRRAKQGSQSTELGKYLACKKYANSGHVFLTATATTMMTILAISLFSPLQISYDISTRITEDDCQMVGILVKHSHMTPCIATCLSLALSATCMIPPHLTWVS
ncbi:hypothetical protein EI94DRAFT_1711770 [Lactarius quietus]|nr:hypothetical protein EI94DRAFT_1711770 [Lactarius quietus]